MQDDLIAVTQADEDAADAVLAVQFDNSHTLYKLEIAAILAEHRQQAEDAMRERCAKVALSPGFIEARDTEWDEGVNYAKRYIATAIRATPPKPDRLNGEGE